jgi:hypothetical protein
MKEGITLLNIFIKKELKEEKVNKENILFPSQTYFNFEIINFIFII